MKKQFFINLILMIALGLSSLSLSFGASKQVYYNGTTQQEIYYDINPIEWPIHDEYNMERLDNLAKQLRQQQINDKYSHEISENKKTASDYPAIQITQKEFNTTNISLDIDKTTKDKDVSEKAINAIVNDKNTIDRLAFELQNKQFLKETDESIKKMDERERNEEIAMLILILICSVIFVIPFISPFVNKERKTKKNNTVNKNIIQAGLKPDIKEIATLVKKATLLKNDFKNIHDQVEINPTMFVKFDFLKTDFYEELSKIDWNKNQNKLLVEKYQLLVNHYADEMNNELKKIEDEFAKAVTENVNQVVEKIEIIKNS